MFKWTVGDAIALPVTLVIIIICAVLMRIFLKSDRAKRIPLMVLAVLIVVLEVCKQIYYNTYEPFTLYILPVHFCSTFIWLMPLAQFTKGKFNKFIKPMPVCYSLIVILIMYAYPHMLLGNSPSAPFASFHNAHTYLFHHTIVAYFVFSVALGDYTPDKKDILPLICGIVFYASYALPLAYVLDVNYVNILWSEFPPFEALRKSAGQVVYNILLFTVAVAATLIIYAAYYFAYNLAQRKKRKSDS